MTTFLADVLTGATVVLPMIGIVIVIFLFLAIWASRYAKVGPNQVLVISGRQIQFIGPDGKVHKSGFRIVKGGGTFVFPVIEKVDVLTLEAVTAEFRFTEVATGSGDRVAVSGSAQVKIKGDDLSIAAAAECFLNQGAEGIRRSSVQIVESHCRKVFAGVALEEVVRSPAAISAKIEEQAGRELADLGVALVSFTIRSFSENDPLMAGTSKPPIAAHPGT